MISELSKSSKKKVYFNCEDLLYGKVSETVYR